MARTCPPLGQVLPPPTAPSDDPNVQKAAKKLGATLDTYFTSNLKSSGVSIIVKSVHEDQPLFTHHYTPPNLSGIGSKNINERTIFRVGSLSKLFPALAALQIDEIRMDDSVLAYIPELQDAVLTNSVESITWDEVTVDSLMTHLSGLPTDSKPINHLTVFSYDIEAKWPILKHSGHGFRHLPRWVMATDRLTAYTSRYWAELLWATRHCSLQESGSYQ
jgi:hypothetical protein